MTTVSRNAIPLPGRRHFSPAWGLGGKHQLQFVNLPMFQHLISVFSESVATLAVTCLGLGVFIYFTLHNWPRITALSRNRSRVAFGRRRYCHPATGSTVAHVPGSPRPADSGEIFWRQPISFTSSAKRDGRIASGCGLRGGATYHNDNARTGQNTLETTLTPDNVNAAKVSAGCIRFRWTDTFTRSRSTCRKSRFREMASTMS